METMTDLPARASRQITPDLARRAAVLAERWAPIRCPSALHGHDCSWYHAAWPMLRALGVVQGVDGDAAFFRDAFAVAARSNDRVLVTAAADHAIVAILLDAYRLQGMEPQITVVDQCLTALALNRWYGRWQGIPVTTTPADIIEFSPGVRFDLITTHSILSFIPAPLRPKLYTNWRSLLNPGGRLVISQAVRPDARAGDARAFTQAEVDAFVTRAMERAASMGIGLSRSTIEALARRFASHKTALVVNSADAIVSGLREAGFDILLLEQHRREPHYASASPDTPDAILNTRIVARAE